MLSIREFCTLYHLSRSRLYQLWAAGDGPTIVKDGWRVLIPQEEAARWSAERYQGLSKSEMLDLIRVVAEHDGDDANRQIDVLLTALGLAAPAASTAERE